MASRVASSSGLSGRVVFVVVIASEGADA